MIPAANITAWRQNAPWPDDTQIEQDLILSRLIVEIAEDDLLRPELSLRGGTCLHKLHLPPAARYSEDLDYVRRTRSGVKALLTALAKIATAAGLSEAGTEFSGPMVHAKFDAVPTSGQGRIRVKIEINIAETDALLPRVDIPYEVDSPWWRGGAGIPTFAAEELLGTKLRALYQRSKGRDLFDLWHAFANLDLDEGQIVECLRHYMGAEEFTYPQLAQNLEAKLEDRDFREDLLQLVIEPPQAYEPEQAATLLMSRLGSRLKNAPDVEEIDLRGWKAARR